MHVHVRPLIFIYLRVCASGSLQVMQVLSFVFIISSSELVFSTKPNILSCEVKFLVALLSNADSEFLAEDAPGSDLSIAISLSCLAGCLHLRAAHKLVVFKNFF
jgi:hypothetical protein